MSTAYRFSADGSMYSSAAVTPQEAATRLERLLVNGAGTVEVEAVKAETIDINDAWGTNGLFQPSPEFRAAWGGTEIVGADE